jgi:hypothetical protein
LVKESGRELVGDAGWGWGEWSTDATEMLTLASRFQAEGLPPSRPIGHTGNRALANKSNGRSALGMRSYLAKNLSGKHRLGLSVELRVWARRGGARRSGSPRVREF